MERLIALLVKFSNALIFLVLEIIAFSLIVNYNTQQGAVYSSFVMSVGGYFKSINDDLISYFNLEQKNQKLVTQNIDLQNKVIKLEAELNAFKHRIPYKRDYIVLSDSQISYPSYNLLHSKVINNTTHYKYNYLTLNKGSNQGIKKDMGVISTEGVAGFIIDVTPEYSIAMSVLNQNFKISTKIKTKDIFCNLIWKETDPQYANISYIPVHVPIQIGDTVITSGHNTFFPEGIMVGKIEKVMSPKEDLGFHHIRIKLSTNFRTLDNVYLVQHKNSEIIDSLNKKFLTK